MPSIRSKLVTVAAVGAAAVGSAAIASAATSGTASSPAAPSSPAPPAMTGHGRHTVDGRTERALTGTVASKVRAAALARVPGTVERVETNVDSGAPYEAHIRKADGTEVEVQVNGDYTVAAVNAMGAGHP